MGITTRTGRIELRCIHCGAGIDEQTAPGCARCNRLRSLPEDWTSHPREVIARIVADLDLGTPTARKTGRDARWPYVPVIDYAGTPSSPKPHQEQVRGLAYATREEALAAAAHRIDRLRLDLAIKLADPRYRALREQYDLPREIT